jgi:hypothetical protein
MSPPTPHRPGGWPPTSPMQETPVVGPLGPITAKHAINSVSALHAISSRLPAVHVRPSLTKGQGAPSPISPEASARKT